MAEWIALVAATSSFSEEEMNKAFSSGSYTPKKPPKWKWWEYLLFWGSLLVSIGIPLFIVWLAWRKA